MNILALIPHYNHEKTIAYVAESMLQMGLDCVIVDDGSDDAAKAVLENLAQEKDIEIIYRSANGGKGAAVKTGIEYAIQKKYSHILQIDADAQHCLADAKKLIDEAQNYPQAIICAEPVYNDDVPKSRLYGRKITNFWLVINTLSFDIRDGMCGFRIYPTIALEQVLAKYVVGNYMDFDIEILVRLHRLGYDLRWVATPVQYQSGGISHFNMWKDNYLISKMHARLFWDMLCSFPRIIQNRFQKK